MSPKFKAEEGGTSQVVLMVTISICQVCRSWGTGCTEFGFGIPWPQPDSIPLIQTRVWDSKQMFGSLLHYLPSISGVEITELVLQSASHQQHGEGRLGSVSPPALSTFVPRDHFNLNPHSTSR